MNDHAGRREIGLDELSEYPTFDHCAINRDTDVWYAAFDRLRAQCPIGKSDEHGGFWVVNGFSEAYDVIHRPETFSNYPTSLPMFPQATRMIPLELDPPDHQRYRKLVAAPFSPRRAQSYADSIRRFVNALIDTFIEDGRSDVCKTIANPLPTLVATTALGLPAADAAKFDEWTYKIVHLAISDFEAGAEAMLDLYTYFYALLEERRANPGEDLMSLLVSSEFDGHRLSEEELMGFCFVLVLASIDTTQRALGSILMHLARDPQLRQGLAADPSKIPSAVEEFLRLYAPVNPARTATQDAEIGGQQIKAGDRILLLLGAANRDGREFDRSGEFDSDRITNRHLAFGASIHRCLGSHIVRVELRVLIEELLRRIPDFEIEDEALVEWSSGQVQGVTRLPVRFTPGQRTSTDVLVLRDLQRSTMS
ncbi:cytochrome P450 [Mycobacterium sp.]|uniref:cytochrome P450 n=1 Tax=Mycobacterium sp. TaxID=1785 RepID=UPI002C9CAABF|nr:cytochrome P450 [Mycobacterium sp.]HKP44058.1 cytochrome P450 [Mycobacterium sp.]